MMCSMLALQASQQLPEEFRDQQARTEQWKREQRRTRPALPVVPGVRLSFEEEVNPKHDNRLDLND